MFFPSLYPDELFYSALLRYSKQSGNHTEYKVKSVIDYGELWKKKLCLLVEEGLTLSKLSQELKVSPETIIRFINVLNLNEKWFSIHPRYKKRAGKYSKRAVRNRKEITCEKRKKWVDLVSNNGYSGSRKLDSNLYNWLLTYDSDWLRESKLKHKSNLLPKEKISRSKFSDQNIVYDEIDYIVKNWSYYELNQPIFMSKAAICRCLNKQPRYDKNKLDIYLGEVAEKREDYILRKLHWAYNELLSQNKSLSRTNLIKISGKLRPEYKDIYNEFCLKHFEK
ncbi:TnsD family Tn7-like transposition protein [Alkalihalobacillus pseudalcaliphilus]|uniref:TnsD family Tn7-like transposition protein n=1 Tax=Alkalihalobacillus pseudalcaliphilus TaxID=79884 RepID=UPI00064DBAAD|nr:TnsD family Tn7-like transposition protein [Alkalihalobacillus pseudalcaliphilus]KMK76745.1 hypothetical protein AB990_07460 [Alkalihalobacillus pseudalcaliphilus]